jgi:hypothetical protein
MLAVHNEVLDVNGMVALDDGQVFNILIEKDDFSAKVSLKRGESARILMPKGVYTAKLADTALEGQYECIALLGPDGLQQGRQVDLTAADEANITLVNKASGAPTIAGGRLQAVKYVIGGGVFLEPANTLFLLNVAGTRVVGSAYSPASDGSAAEVGEAPSSADGEDSVGERQPDAGYAVPGETGPEAVTTPNGIGIAWGDGQAAAKDSAAAAKDSAADGEGISGGKSAAGSDGDVKALAAATEPYLHEQSVAQGMSVIFETGSGSFAITEMMGENSGYELASIVKYDENTADLPAATAKGLAFDVLDSVGTVVIALNKVVPIVPPPPPVAVGGSDNGADRSFKGEAEPIAVELPDEVLPEGAAIQEHIQYIFGYPDGTVRPDLSVTRAEAAAILFRLMAAEDGASRPAGSSYADVQAGDWHARAIEYLTAAGILDGYPDGTFRPNDPIARGEFAKMIVGANGLDATAGNAFGDVAGHWAAGYANSAAAKGWFEGYSDGSFRPQNNLTRAEAVTAMNRVYGRETSPENIPGYAPRFADLPLTHWAYAAITEASITHYCDRLEDGTEIWVDSSGYALGGLAPEDAAGNTPEGVQGESIADADVAAGAYEGAQGESPADAATDADIDAAADTDTDADADADAADGAYEGVQGEVRDGFEESRAGIVEPVWD